MRIYGIDFTSAPGRGKALTCAACEVEGDTLSLEWLCLWETFCGLKHILGSEGPWVAAIDFPFGLPVEFVNEMQWPPAWADYVGALPHDKDAFCQVVRDFKLRQPDGLKNLKRCVDEKARSASPLNIDNPPVGKMFFQGAPRLLLSPASIEPVRPIPGESRIVVEGYPALVVRHLCGEHLRDKRKYKGRRKEQREDCRALRSTILDRLRNCGHYGVTVDIPDDLQEKIVADRDGDLLDALLAAVQGAWAWRQGAPAYGLPADAPRLEGWIADPAVCGAIATPRAGPA